jgi:hypothetical protein
VIRTDRPKLGLYICLNTVGIQLCFLKINCKSFSLK